MLLRLSSVPDFNKVFVRSVCFVGRYSALSVTDEDRVMPSLDFKQAPVKNNSDDVLYRRLEIAVRIALLWRFR